MKRKQTLHEKIAEQANDIREEEKRWDLIRKGGCSDPSWPDGANMNLTRNHIIYAKQNIRELCKESGESPPEEFYFPTPPRVDENFFANPNSKRARRIKTGPFWKCANVEPPEKRKFEEAQMSLF